MSKQYTLFETRKQEIKLAQVVHSIDSDYIVYETYRQHNKTEYKLINPSTYQLCITEVIKPIEESFGVGFFCDYDNPTYISYEDVGLLLTEAYRSDFAETVENNLHFELTSYSEKAIALFGDTKSIKDLLKAMGGKFNPKLTHNNRKQAGWIFSTSKREELNTVLNLNK